MVQSICDRPKSEKVSVHILNKGRSTHSAIASAGQTITYFLNDPTLICTSHESRVLSCTCGGWVRCARVACEAEVTEAIMVRDASA